MKDSRKMFDLGRKISLVCVAQGKPRLAGWSNISIKKIFHERLPVQLPTRKHILVRFSSKVSFSFRLEIKSEHTMRDILWGTYYEEFSRPHITWLKDGIELNSFSEHEHVSTGSLWVFDPLCHQVFEWRIKRHEIKVIIGLGWQLRNSRIFSQHFPT